MKPIILDMNEMSDSKEVYESRPHPFFVIFIYMLLLMLTIAIIWAACFKLDVVVKGIGLVSSREASSVVTNTYSGAITKCYITDGQEVSKGDILYEVEATDLDLQLTNYREQQAEVSNRIEMIEAYMTWLSDHTKDFNTYVANPYFSEYAARKQVVTLQMELTQTEFASQKEAYDAKLAAGSSMIEYYESEINKLNLLSVGIRTRQNTFEETDSYYYAKLNSYITQYNNTVAQYDATLKSLQKELDEAEDKVEQADKEIKSADETIAKANKEINAAKERISAANQYASAFDTKLRLSQVEELQVAESEEPVVEANVEEKEAVVEEKKVVEEEKIEQEVEAVVEEVQVVDTSADEALIAKKQEEIASAQNKKTLAQSQKTSQEAIVQSKKDAISTTTLQKNTALTNLETETIAGVEASIISYQQNILATNGTQAELMTTKSNITEQGVTNNTQNLIQTELQSVSAELSNMKATYKELETKLTELTNGLTKTVVKAPTDGVVNMQGELVVGNYLSAGKEVMTLIPCKEDGYIVKSYINNQDIAKIQNDMSVKYEVAAYPSSEYGSMTGEVEFVSADLKANSEDGSAYYVVETSIDSTNLYNKDGDKMDLKVGMQCETKIIVEQKSVLKTLLQKINLLD